MKGRNRILSLATVLSVLLILSVFFASGLVSVPRFLGAPGTPLSPSPSSVFVNPRWYIKDYSLAPIGSKFTVNVDISGASDLYTWHVNVTYNKNILSVSKIFPGEFLRRSPNLTASEVLPGGFVINSTDNTKGYSGFAESILGTITGQTGDGRLASIEFLIVGYGATPITFSLGGNFGTTLISSTGVGEAPSTINGFFDNRIPGDITGPENPPGSGLYPYDRKVDGYDLIYLCKKFGTADPVADFTGAENPPGSGTYPPDGTVDGRDLIALCKNFGRTV